MKRNHSSLVSDAPAAAPLVHQNGKTETEGLHRATGFTQCQAISSGAVDRVSASGSCTLRLLLAGALSLIEYFFYRGAENSIAHLSAATCIAFVLLGGWSLLSRRAGALVALIVFGVSTSAMAVIAMTTEQGIELVIKPLIARLVVLLVLYRGFELQDEQQILQRSH